MFEGIRANCSNVTKILLRAAKRGCFKRGGFPIWTCPSFFVLFCPFGTFPGIFPICAGTVRGFSRLVLFLFLGLLRAPTRNSPERVRDTIWTIPEKSGKHPGLETPRFSFSQYWSLSVNRRRESSRANRPDSPCESPGHLRCQAPESSTFKSQHGEPCLGNPVSLRFFLVIQKAQPAPKYHTKGFSRSFADSPGAWTLVFAAFQPFHSCEHRASTARTPFCAILWRSPKSALNSPDGHFSWAKPALKCPNWCLSDAQSRRVAHEWPHESTRVDSPLF